MSMKNRKPPEPTIKTRVAPTNESLIKNDLFFQHYKKLSNAWDHRSMINSRFFIERATSRIDNKKENKAQQELQSKKFPKSESSPNLNPADDLDHLLKFYNQYFKQTTNDFYKYNEENKLFITAYRLLTQGIENHWSNKEVDFELKEYEKITETLFNPNPLLMKEQSDIKLFFIGYNYLHFLKTKLYEIKANDMKSTKFLNHLNSFLSYWELFKDKEINDVTSWVSKKLKENEFYLKYPIIVNQEKKQKAIREDEKCKKEINLNWIDIQKSMKSIELIDQEYDINNINRDRIMRNTLKDFDNSKHILNQKAFDSDAKVSPAIKMSKKWGVSGNISPIIHNTLPWKHNQSLMNFNKTSSSSFSNHRTSCIGKPAPTIKNFVLVKQLMDKHISVNTSLLNISSSNSNKNRKTMSMGNIFKFKKWKKSSSTTSHAFNSTNAKTKNKKGGFNFYTNIGNCKWNDGSTSLTENDVLYRTIKQTNLVEQKNKSNLEWYFAKKQINVNYDKTNKNQMLNIIQKTKSRVQGLNLRKKIFKMYDNKIPFKVYGLLRESDTWDSQWCKFDYKFLKCYINDKMKV